MYKEFIQICRQRHSIRSFNSQPVGEAQIRQILEAVQTVPTAGNLQAFEVVLVKDPDQIAALAQATTYKQMWITEAPAVMVFVALPTISGKKYNERGEKLYALQDATIACAIAQLAVTALGLATTWIGAFNEDEVYNILHCQSDQRAVAMLPIGYGAAEPKTTSRRSLVEITREL